MSTWRTWTTAAVVGALLGAAATTWWWTQDAADGGSGPSTATAAPVPTTPPPDPAPTAEPAATAGAQTVPTSVIPVVLQGTWCTRSGESAWGGGSNPCFSFADLLAEYPGMTLDQDDALTVGAGDGATSWTACLVLDLAPEGCSVAASMYVEHFPPGAAWDCPAAAADYGAPRCEPDFTAAHDRTQPRLVVRPNHPVDDTYHDVEPMYPRP